MEKEAIIEALKSQLRAQYERAVAALNDAAEGATGEDTRAESKYDTRGLESSYLAAGQAEQAERLARELRSVEGFDFPTLSNSSPIEPGALVGGKLEGNSVFYLLAPGGGGLTIETDQGELVTVIGASSPLRANLLDLKVGDFVERPPLEIRSVQ